MSQLFYFLILFLILFFLLFFVFLWNSKTGWSGVHDNSIFYFSF